MTPASRLDYKNVHSIEALWYNKNSVRVNKAKN